MGRVISFPVAARAAQVARGRRVFESLRELEDARHRAHVLSLNYLLVSATFLTVLELLALRLWQ